MKNEWNQIDFILEDCPIHGYRITQIPVRTIYGINKNKNYYTNIDQPTLFPYERNIIHSISNDAFINSNREKYYSLNDYDNHISEEERNIRRMNYSGNNIPGFEQINDNSSNYSFYVSGTTRLKPRTTINNSSNQYNNQITDNYNRSQRHNYIIPFYNDNNKSYSHNKRNKKILYKYNNNYELSRPKKTIDKYVDEPILIQTEPEEMIELNNNINKQKNYYLTPNYYSNNEEDCNLDANKYYIKRNTNNSVRKINSNINERMILEKINLGPKRKIKIKKGNKKYINNNDISFKEKKSRRNNYYNNMKYQEINSVNKQPSLINTTKDKFLIDSSFNDIRDQEEMSESDKVKVKITNLNNHKFFISNDKIINSNRKTKFSQNPNRMNNYILENLNQNINIEKNLNHKKYLENDNNNIYKLKFGTNKKEIMSSEPNLRYRNENDNENRKGREELNVVKYREKQTSDGKDENIEQHIEKYYDSRGNCIGGKNVIIKKKYNDNGEQIIKEITKEEYKSNYNELFKKDIPDNEENIQEDQKKYFPYYLNSEKINKIENNNLKNNNDNNFEEIIKESKNEENLKNSNFTFGIKSDNFRFELDDKEEKEADEQQIMVNSEFEEEGYNDDKNKNDNFEKNFKEDNNEKMNKEILMEKKSNN